MSCNCRSHRKHEKPDGPLGMDSSLLIPLIAGLSANSNTNDCSPLEHSLVCERKVERCCDQDGCCALYPANCRNEFWPEFSHPRWLCCKDLYSNN